MLLELWLNKHLLRCRITFQAALKMLDEKEQCFASGFELSLEGKNGA